MKMGRSLRRASPITLLLAALLAVGFLIFLLSPSQPSAKSKYSGAASHPLSPPTSPFRKPKANAARVPPPVVHYHLNNLTTSATPIENQETVLILTPLTNYRQEFWDNLLALSYPHDLIALGFIIPKNRDGNAATTALQAAIASTQSGPEKKRFASITIIRQDFDPPSMPDPSSEHHAMMIQKSKRAGMATARNSLLFTTLGPATAWVLWLDGDIIETPPSLIQDLAAHDKPIIVPNCYQRKIDRKTGQTTSRPYDFANWQDSDQAQELARNMDKDDVIMEGFADMTTKRVLMVQHGDAKGDKTKEMQLDGVGGKALLVKAEVHRDGAMFPPFAFYHLIETEGFARMAKRLGWSSWGLPNYFVYHAEE